MAAVQEINPYGEIHYVTDLQNVLQTRNAVIGFGMQFLDGSTLNLRYQNGFERLDTPFSVSGIPIPLGYYATNQGSVTYTSSRARPLSARVSLSGGGFWNGSRYTVSGSAIWRARYRWAFDASWSHNDISLPGGSFSTDVMVGHVEYFIHAPLSDFFLVYTERRDLDVGVVLDRVVAAKVTKLFAF
jgi:hypothetical protein